MYRLISPSVFLLVTAVGLSATVSYHEAVKLAETSRFTSLAEQASNSIVSRVGNHISLLHATRALYSANKGEVNEQAFSAFVSGLDLSGEYSGVQGIGFAKVFQPDGEPDIAADLKRNYNLDREVWPDSSEDLRTAILLLEPSNPRNIAALGYDMYSDPVRRAAMRSAVELKDAVASGPVELVQEITEDKQAGFLVYLPWYAPGADESEETDENPLDGFIYAPFRAGDLHRAALEPGAQLPVLVETFDVSGNEPIQLYKSGGFESRVADSGPKVIVSAEVAGRNWEFNIYPTRQFRDPSDYYPVYGLGVGVLLIAFFAAALSHAQFRAGMTARALATANRQGLEEKELMLQEMKHRLKNAIARIAAIARQTASNSEDLEEFSQSFQSRMISMANAQDMLTRSQWSRADLRELLYSEVSQVLGDDVADEALSGDAVELNEKATQALGLVFHELATNALKYGAVTDAEGVLSVSWRIDGRGRQRNLLIEWVEKRAPIAIQADKKPGFGTRLIDMNIKLELSGTIEREIGESQIRILIRLPNASVS
ncbi:CHASE domain-containing protein [uncultured Roseibium sp.]|uniref:CHASE domain-containing protein n=1 Tax=uncultured Roseibium sp. TaxID=1936171 RepID=UPI0025984CCC|nr:CHASE domain-containing protein [uncultured Roseibium sp.]